METSVLEKEQYDIIKEQLGIKANSEYLDNVIEQINSNDSCWNVRQDCNWQTVDGYSSEVEKLVAVYAADQIINNTMFISQDEAVDRHIEDVTDNLDKKVLIENGYYRFDDAAVVRDWADGLYDEVDVGTYVSTDIDQYINDYTSEWDDLSEEEQAEWLDSNDYSIDEAFTKYAENTYDLEAGKAAYVGAQLKEKHARDEDDIFEDAIACYSENDIPDNWLELNRGAAEDQLLINLREQSWDYPIQVDVEENGPERFITCGDIGNAFTPELIQEAQQAALQVVSQEVAMDYLQDHPELLDTIDWSETCLADKKTQLDMASTLEGNDRKVFLEQMANGAEAEAEIEEDFDFASTDWESELSGFQSDFEAKKAQEQGRDR